VGLKVRSDLHSLLETGRVTHTERGLKRIMGLFGAGLNKGGVLPTMPSAHRISPAGSRDIFLFFPNLQGEVIADWLEMAMITRARCPF